MAGRDEARTDLARVPVQLAELEPVVAAHARVGRPARGVLVHEVVDDLPELRLQVQRIKRNVEPVGDTASVFRVPAIYDYQAQGSARYADYFTFMRLGRPLADVNEWYWIYGKMLPPTVRRPLLDQGVRLYELRPEAAGSNGPRRSGVTMGSSRASLHAKTFVFDRTSVFIGSVNLDPRSLEKNTEVGVLVNSPELAVEVASLFDHWSSPALAYEVTRGENGRLEWTGGFTTEPNAGFWRPLGAKLFSHLPIDSLI